MEGAKTAPVDVVGSCHLAGTVYGGRILPLPTKRHPRQQRDHLQRPAQIAEIMHFPPRPDLSVSAAIRTLMHPLVTVHGDRASPRGLHVARSPCTVTLPPSRYKY